MKHFQGVFLIILFALSVFLQGCAATPLVSENAIGRKLSSLPLGEPKERAVGRFGQPRFIVTIPRGQDLIEIWGYDLGSFAYVRTGLLVFRNNQLVAVPRSDYELLRHLHLMRVIDQAEFWSPVEGSYIPPDRQDVFPSLARSMNGSFPVGSGEKRLPAYGWE